MRRVLVLLVATALYASVKCEDSSGFGSEQISANIAYLNIKYQNLQLNYELLQKTLQQHLEKSKQRISTFQTQLESNNVDQLKLQRQVSVLFEENIKNAESIKNQNKTPIEEIGQLNSSQNTLREQLKALENEQRTIQQQLKQSEENISKLQHTTESKDSASKVKWVSWSAGEAIPENAAFAGNHWDNAPMYVGRIHHSGIDHVVKVLPTRQEAYYSYLERERRVQQCEVLTGSNFSWVRDSDGSVPANAVPIGKHSRGEAHYVGRAHVSAQGKSSLVPGVVNSKDRALYLGFLGIEHRITSYEALVQN